MSKTKRDELVKLDSGLSLNKLNLNLQLLLAE